MIDDGEVCPFNVGDRVQYPAAVQAPPWFRSDLRGPGKITSVERIESNGLWLASVHFDAWTEAEAARELWRAPCSDLERVP